ncbi:MAG: alkaline phosphatase family protein [Gloeobacteraceae cyanobacterium ES-bin-316]|nr:alkaline phosphatase family protein [Ferruginibacter sp.]
MKLLICLLLQLVLIKATAQPAAAPTNVFIITTDGLRWQEVFNGADDRILKNPLFVKDTLLTNEMYGGASAEEKRKKLMPFFWSTLARQGQLHGNRAYNNKVDVSNFYKISYPGYNEILTGYADPLLMENKPILNKNTNLLEYLNTRESYKGSVVAFSSWDVFPFIINEERSKITVNSGYENMTEQAASFKMINKVQDSVHQKTGTRYDQLTFLNAKEYLQKYHPKIMMLGLGETDEFGHQKKYDLYLQQANNVDKMIAELWYFAQTDSFYKGNTIFIISTDHGRGSNPGKWHTHGFLNKGASETWLAMIGPGIKQLGEIKNDNQIYQKQLAATIAQLINQKFEANHPIATAFKLPSSATDQKSGGSNFSFVNNSLLPPLKMQLVLVLAAILLLLGLIKQKTTGLLQQ